MIDFHNKVVFCIFVVPQGILNADGSLNSTKSNQRLADVALAYSQAGINIYTFFLIRHYCNKFTIRFCQVVKNLLY